MLSSAIDHCITFFFFSQFCNRNPEKLLKDNSCQNPTFPQLDESDPKKKAIGLCTEDLVYMEKIEELQDYLDKVNAKFLVINSSVFYSNLFIFRLLIAHCLHFGFSCIVQILFFFPGYFLCS